MSDESFENRKKQRYKKKRLRQIMILIIMGYFVLRTIPNFSGISAKTVLPKKEIMIDAVKLEGVILKNEQTYEISGELSDDLKLDEGKKVPVGYKINNADINSEMGKKKTQLDSVNEAIRIKNLSDEEKQITINQNKNIHFEKEAISESIQENIDDYGKVRDLKKAMYDTESKLVDLNPQNEYLSYDLENLQGLSNEISEEINNNMISYSTQNSGLISYKIDGYEDKLKPQNLEEYTYEALSSLDRNIEPKSGFRVIDNFYWYMAIIVDDFTELQGKEEDIIISLTINDVDLELDGRVMAVNREGEKGVIVVRFNNHMEDFYNERFVIANIIKSKRNSYKIPNRTIFEKDNIKGVYIKEFSGIVRFRPVEVLKEEGDFTYISEGDAGYIELKEDEKIRTVDMYDEIILSPSSVEEGQIIN